ncbi:MAG: hypothetical protein KC731_26490 [Myxococcales bacterium]|nr:hypothetical protein [Myxococcales bacterium]
MDFAQVLARLARLGRAVGAETKDVTTAVHALRALLEEAAVDYRIVGGLAVIHHGYPRLTEDVDVLVEAGGVARLKGQLESHGFSQPRADRLLHDATQVRVDLLEQGQPMPGPDRPSYPSPAAVGHSDSDPFIIALPGLLQLKIYAGRKQDEADAVALLKLLDEGRYLAVEAQLPAALRPQLLLLRRDALEELAWERSDA